ncbi:MAG: DNA oxidative demethylase AlkB [Bryobacteraceae bacterium]
MTEMDLFGAELSSVEEPLDLGPGVAVLRGFALKNEAALLSELKRVTEAAPFRHMVTAGGFRMSVAMTNCGPLGWISDRRGYRYEETDPVSGDPWPPIPDLFLKLAGDAANAAGFPLFTPNACLINRYEPGAKMSLHQDKDEKDFTQPIVSVSLGLPAVFQFGGLKRSEETRRIQLTHGDVVVWGGPARLRYHGVLPLKKGTHPTLGNHRLNLTFRKAI